MVSDYIVPPIQPTPDSGPWYHSVLGKIENAQNKHFGTRDAALARASVQYGNESVDEFYYRALGEIWEEVQYVLSNFVSLDDLDRHEFSFTHSNKAVPAMEQDWDVLIRNDALPEDELLSIEIIDKDGYRTQLDVFDVDVDGLDLQLVMDKESFSTSYIDKAFEAMEVDVYSGTFDMRDEYNLYKTTIKPDAKVFDMSGKDIEITRLVNTKPLTNTVTSDILQYQLFSDRAAGYRNVTEIVIEGVSYKPESGETFKTTDEIVETLFGNTDVVIYTNEVESPGSRSMYVINQDSVNLELASAEEIARFNQDVKIKYVQTSKSLDLTTLMKNLQAGDITQAEYDEFVALLVDPSEEAAETAKIKLYGTTPTNVVDDIQKIGTLDYQGWFHNTPIVQLITTIDENNLEIYIKNKSGELVRLELDDTAQIGENAIQNSPRFEKGRFALIGILKNVGDEDNPRYQIDLYSKNPDELSKLEEVLPASLDPFNIPEGTPYELIPDTPKIPDEPGMLGKLYANYNQLPNKYMELTLPLGLRQWGITSFSDFNPKQFEQIAERILNNTASDEDLTRFYILLISNSEEYAYGTHTFKRSDSIADRVKVGIFSDRTPGSIIAVDDGPAWRIFLQGPPDGIYEKTWRDIIRAFGGDLSFTNVVQDLVNGVGQFQDLQERARKVILDKHSQLYNHVDDFLILFRTGRVLDQYHWTSGSKSQIAAEGVRNQTADFLGHASGDYRNQAYIIHKNDFIDLEALGLSFSKEREVMILTEATKVEGALIETQSNTSKGQLTQDDIKRVIANWDDIVQNLPPDGVRIGFDIDYTKRINEYGQSTQKFFDEVITGSNPAYHPKTNYRPIIQFSDKRLKDAQGLYNTLVANSGNFNTHIFTSIPTFYETQIVKAAALSSPSVIEAIIAPAESGSAAEYLDILAGRGTSLPVEGQSRKIRILDIAGTEGTWAKLVGQLLPNAEVNVLDPNREAAEVFHKLPVQNVGYINEAYTPFPENYKLPYIEAENILYWNGYLPDSQNYDVIHESMGFQFMDVDRAAQIEDLKTRLNPDGVLFLEEKFILPEEIYVSNEITKDDFKRQYYDSEQMILKSEEALGFMESRLATLDEVMVSLQKNFKNVVQYWDAGNFKGFVASDGPAAETFVEEIKHLDTTLTAHPYSTNPTPAEVKVAVNRGIARLGFDTEFIKQIATDFYNKNIEHMNEVKNVLDKTWDVSKRMGGRAFVSAMPILAPGDILIENAIQKVTPWLDDVGKKLGFARMPLVTSVMLPVYAAYEIALAGAEIVSAAMYAADDSLKKSAGSKKPNILYQQFDWGQEALEEYYDMQEFYNSPTGKAYLEEVDFGSLFMKELEKEKLTQYSPGWSLTKTIWSLLGTMNDEPTQQYYTNWSR